MTTMAVRAARGSAQGTGRPTAFLVLDLFGRARGSLREALATDAVFHRFICAHTSAIRTAAAVVAAREAPVRRGRAVNVWQSLAAAAPELQDWAEFFAGNSDRRTAASIGVVGSITPRMADDMVRAANEFLTAAGGVVGYPGQGCLAELATPLRGVAEGDSAPHWFDAVPSPALTQPYRPAGSVRAGGSRVGGVLHE